MGVVKQNIAAAHNPGVAGSHDEGYCPFLEGRNIPYAQCGDASFVWTTSANKHVTQSCARWVSFVIPCKLRTAYNLIDNKHICTGWICMWTANAVRSGRHQVHVRHTSASVQIRCVDLEASCACKADVVGMYNNN